MALPRGIVFSSSSFDLDRFNSFLPCSGWRDQSSSKAVGVGLGECLCDT